MAALCLRVGLLLAWAALCVGVGLLLAWAAPPGNRQALLGWHAEAFRRLQTRALQRLHRSDVFLGWKHPALRNGAPRRLSACPTFARYPEADSNGDCVCPRERPACFQGGQKWCLRNDGVRDFHFFSMSCETCTCQIETAKEGEEGGNFVAPSTCEAEGLGEGEKPNKQGFCSCPEERPMCVTVTDLFETPGCSLGTPENTLDARMFKAGCTNCACRQTCPEIAHHTFADSFGDCACPQSMPICYEDGVKGCAGASGDGVNSNSYFRANCGKICECRVAVGACEPATCVTSTDCEFEACYDCEMCLGISKCPDVGVINDLPNANGNCQCGTELSCFQGTDELPGCPIAPFGESSTSFRANCRGCKCDVLKTGSVLLGLQCPPFAKEELPDRYGDCVCPPETADCWEDGNKWCTRNDQRRDLRYFSVRCSTCECRQAPEAAELSRMQPCPDFARDELSDAYRNCACPPAKPLCVEGEIANEGSNNEESAEQKRIGPMCVTTHGWTSSTHFRYDCTNCICMEVEGEGSRLRKIRPDELTEQSGILYMKHHLVVDLRVINSYDTVTAWAQEYDDLTILSYPQYARGVEGGLSYLDIVSAALCQVIELRGTRVYEDPTLEEVHAMRVYVEFGVMWAEGEERRLALADMIPWVNSSNSSMSRVLSSDKEIKHVEELSPRETFLLLNFASIFNEALFGSELENQLWQRLNATWEGRKANGTVGKNPSWPVEAPRVEVTRVIVDDQAPLPPLSWEGPLNQGEPERRHLDRDTGPVEEEGVPVVAVLATVGALMAFAGCCCCTCYGCYERRKEMRRQAEMTMVRIGKNDSPQSTARKSDSPTGSPRTFGKGGGRASVAPQAGRYSLAARHKREETNNSILLGGGSGNKEVVDKPASKGGLFGKFTGRGRGNVEESPRSSPRGSSARGSRMRESSPRGSSARNSEMITSGMDRRRSDGSPTGSPRRDSVAQKSNRRQSSKDARPVVDRKLVKRMGDLAGHKALSEAAKAALEAEFEKKQENAGGRRGRASVGANVFGRKSQTGSRKSQAKGDSSPTRKSETDNSPGSSESDDPDKRKSSKSEAGTESKSEGDEPKTEEKPEKKSRHDKKHKKKEKGKPKGRCRRLLHCLFVIIKKLLSIFLLPLRLMRRCVERCCCRFKCCRRCKKDKKADKQKSRGKRRG